MTGSARNSPQPPGSTPRQRASVCRSFRLQTQVANLRRCASPNALGNFLLFASVMNADSRIYWAEKTECPRFTQAAAEDLGAGPGRDFQVVDIFDFLASLTHQFSPVSISCADGNEISYYFTSSLTKPDRRAGCWRRSDVRAMERCPEGCMMRGRG